CMAVGRRRSRPHEEAAPGIRHDMAAHKAKSERPCSCGSGRKWGWCHGLPEPQRPTSCTRSQARRLHDPVTPAELFQMSERGLGGFSSSALSELAGGRLHGIRLLGQDLGSTNFQGADLGQAYLYIIPPQSLRYPQRISCKYAELQRESATSINS